MVKMSLVYEGGLHCQLTHGPSKSMIVTDAPTDNMGKGEAFSPTDLMAASLGACVMTVMGIVAQRHNIRLEGATAEIVKEMVIEPVRRIGKISVVIKMPESIAADKRPMLERAAHSCPVHKSIHPDVDIQIDLIYPD